MACGGYSPCLQCCSAETFGSPEVAVYHKQRMFAKCQLWWFGRCWAEGALLMLHRNRFAQEQRAAGAEELFAHHHHQNILYLCSCQMQVNWGRCCRDRFRGLGLSRGAARLCCVLSLLSGEADSAGSTKALISFSTKSPIQGKLRPGLCCSSYWVPQGRQSAPWIFTHFP